MLTLNLEREAEKRDRETDPRVRKTLRNPPTSALTAILKTSTLGVLWSLSLRGSGSCRNWPGQGCSSPQVAPAELNKKWTHQRAPAPEQGDGGLRQRHVDFVQARHAFLCSLLVLSRHPEEGLWLGRGVKSTQELIQQAFLSTP